MQSSQLNINSPYYQASSTLASNIDFSDKSLRTIRQVNSTRYQSKFQDHLRAQLKTEGTQRVKIQNNHSNLLSKPTQSDNKLHYSNVFSLTCDETIQQNEVASSKSPLKALTPNQYNNIKFQVQPELTDNRLNSQQRKKKNIKMFGDISNKRNLKIYSSVLTSRRQSNMNIKNNHNISLEPYTSPGDYNVPHIIGNIQISVSNIQTSPNYTFSKQNRKLQSFKKSLTSKNSQKINYSTIASKLCESQEGIPGVGEYCIDNFDLKQRPPAFSIGKSDRFLRQSTQQESGTMIPLQHQDTTQSQAIELSQKFGVIGLETRFKPLQERSPGPGAYETQLYNSLSKNDFSICAADINISPKQSQRESFRYNSILRQSHNNLNMSSRDQQTKIYHNAYSKDFLNKIGPGPGYYEYEKVKNEGEQHRYSMPKCSRMLENDRKQDEKRIPISYSDISKEIKLLLNGNGKNAVVPRSTKRFDPRKMTALHANLWSKGVIM